MHFCKFEAINEEDEGEPRLEIIVRVSDHTHDMIAVSIKMKDGPFSCSDNERKDNV